VTGDRPPGWREAIAEALRAAPEPSAQLCEDVAGLFGASAFTEAAGPVR
jgi:hypothetical protein